MLGVLSHGHGWQQQLQVGFNVGGNIGGDWFGNFIGSKGGTRVGWLGSGSRGGNIGGRCGGFCVGKPRRPSGFQRRWPMNSNKNNWMFKNPNVFTKQLLK